MSCYLVKNRWENPELIKKAANLKKNVVQTKSEKKWKF